MSNKPIDELEVEQSNPRWQELAALTELRLQHWQEITGVGIGKDAAYDVTQEGVYPEQYRDDDLRLLTTEESRILLEIAASQPLTFPCTPKELINFIDDYPLGDLDVPGEFRAAVERLPKDTQSGFDISAERGCRRMILENWAVISTVHGNNADGRQVLRIIDRNKDADQKTPSLKTVRNKLCELRREKLIP